MNITKDTIAELKNLVRDLIDTDMKFHQAQLTVERCMEDHQQAKIRYNEFMKKFEESIK